MEVKWVDTCCEWVSAPFHTYSCVSREQQRNRMLQCGSVETPTVKGLGITRCEHSLREGNWWKMNVFFEVCWVDEECCPGGNACLWIAPWLQLFIRVNKLPNGPFLQAFSSTNNSKSYQRAPHQCYYQGCRWFSAAIRLWNLTRFNLPALFW